MLNWTNYLNPEANGRLLVDALTNVEAGLDNVLPSAAQPVHLLQAYERWVGQAETVLGNVVSLSEIVEWLHDIEFWRIQQTHDQVQKNRQISLDLARRRRELRQLRSATESFVQQWSEPEVELVVLDTNTIVNRSGERLADVYWAKEVNSRNRIRLAIPWIVLRELDRIKETSKSETKTRAQAAIRWLQGLGPIHERAGVLREDRHTASDRGLSVQLYVPLGSQNFDDPDFTIIENARTLAQISGLTTHLATYDISMGVRARVHGLKVIQPKNLEYPDPAAS